MIFEKNRKHSLLLSHVFSPWIFFKQVHFGHLFLSLRVSIWSFSFGKQSKKTPEKPQDENANASFSKTRKELTSVHSKIGKKSYQKLESSTGQQEHGWEVRRWGWDPDRMVRGRFVASDISRCSLAPNVGCPPGIKSHPYSQWLVQGGLLNSVWF